MTTKTQIEVKNYDVWTIFNTLSKLADSGNILSAIGLLRATYGISEDFREFCDKSGIYLRIDGVQNYGLSIFRSKILIEKMMSGEISFSYEG